jgi:superoxide dismutase
MRRRSARLATSHNRYSVPRFALYSGRLLDVLVDEHHYGAIWDGVPLIACDVFEHAYYHKDGPARATYIDNFLANLHWGRINERFKRCEKMCVAR